MHGGLLQFLCAQENCKTERLLAIECWDSATFCQAGCLRAGASDGQKLLNQQVFLHIQYSLPDDEHKMFETCRRQEMN